jgi:hypothetical protein
VAAEPAKVSPLVPGAGSPGDKFAERYRIACARERRRVALHEAYNVKEALEAWDHTRHNTTELICGLLNNDDGKYLAYPSYAEWFRALAGQRQSDAYEDDICLEIDAQIEMLEQDHGDELNDTSPSEETVRRILAFRDEIRANVKLELVVYHDIKALLDSAKKSNEPGKTTLEEALKEIEQREAVKKAEYLAAAIRKDPNHYTRYRIRMYD